MAPKPLEKHEFDAYNIKLQAAALKPTRLAAGLPSDLSYHRSVDRSVAKELDACSDKVLAITNRLLSLASSAETSKSSKGKEKAKLEDQDDFLDRFQSLVVESMDQLLERADISLDQFLGRTKAPAIAVNPPSQNAKRSSAPSGRLDPALQHAHYLAKPQLKFKRKVINTNGEKWYPSLRHKYNAQVPLGYNFLSKDVDGDSEKALPPHPYRHEIANLSYPSRMFQSSPPISYRPFSETPFTWVSTSTQLAVMLEKLRKATEIAIDLEYHSYRSFGGFVCLMQISTREEDWIVDTLELRDELEELNEVFTDPNIVKVLHGAESDIVWLQQDFNVYIVNLFDTFHASKVLDFPRHGLAALLEMYCDFAADKKYQLADWRIRPLPEEMLQYARSDTHFLLYIYDNLRNALLDREISRAQSRAQSPSSVPHSRPISPLSPDSFVREVLSRSAETSLRVYEREYYDTEGGSGPSGWDTMARKWNKVMLMADGPGGMKREVYKAVHAWRDRVAREEDESTRYVLSNHFLFQLAERPPPDMAGLLATFQSVPPIIRRRAKELLDVVREAVARGLRSQTASEPTVTTTIASGATQVQSMDVDVSEAALSKGAEVSSSLATQLWSRSGTLPSVSTSALFGASILPASATHPPATAYASSRSVLFGGTPSAPSGPSVSGGLHARFQEVVSRIHRALVIAPTAPQVSPMPNEAASTVTTAVVAANAEAGPSDEIPFIPASQRQSVKVEAVDDTIVVVGQARQKKRKRSKKTDAEDVSALQAGTARPKEGVAAPKGTKAEPESVPFDFATASNILDDERVEEEKKGPKKRQKKNKGSGGVLEYGNFPAPPRDRSQVKSGNQSHTFRT
ncbi:hypothetical protein BV25DRAFT_1917713 [Artomyces pyxidatus]|uniref:Uncharacterized protein n=1 Tax=Artomyces pyxidatus TaxID=48021 RepID=A0ACB8SXD5_9AGAM|nr:hypothetical protein BV25DRAFT_1917713 [Artomyces pyxidatus]